MSRDATDDSAPPPPIGEAAVENADAEGLEALLEFLKRTRGFDFSGYKRSTLSRRIMRRLQTLSIARYADYVDYLEVHPDEYPLLFNTVLINVTGFFRDGTAWTSLAAHIRRLVESKRPDDAIRIWCAGCASGEEAYTLAIIVADILGVEACVRRTKIYATDLDEEALAQARQASYAPRAVEGVAPETLEKYFVRGSGGYGFHRELRRAVIFGRHDLVQDAPISRIDVLSCRNTLMYFNAETQTKILERLNFALAPDGILFLGKAEMLLTHTDLFTPIDLKLRLFQRARTDARPRPEVFGMPAPPLDEQMRVYKGTFDAPPLARIVVDANGCVGLVNARAAQMFALGIGDIGKPFRDLDVAYRSPEVRVAINLAVAERRAMSTKGVERTGPGGESSYLDVEVTPLVVDDGFAGIQVTFLDVTSHHRVEAELRRASSELESAHEELQSTSEELETTNEELQSTVEELETTNEELQSTNEELETTNEELQSTNEELETMNDELRQRSLKLDEVNAFLTTILGSLRAGVVVLDRDLHVKAWNKEMEDLFGLRADEVNGKNFLNLDIGVPMQQLRMSLRAATEGREEARALDCTNRRGKAIKCKVTVSQMRGDDVPGAILLFEQA